MHDYSHLYTAGQLIEVHYADKQWAYFLDLLHLFANSVSKPPLHQQPEVVVVVCVCVCVCVCVNGRDQG